MRLALAGQATEIYIVFDDARNSQVRRKTLVVHAPMTKLSLGPKSLLTGKIQGNDTETGSFVGL